MSETIYVITTGVYSDYRIIGASKTRDGAEAFVKVFGGDIEEFPDMVPALSQGYRYYFIRMDREGKTIECTTHGEPQWAYCGFDINGNFITNLWAKSVDHAVKIANERRAQVIAFDCWGDKSLLERFDWGKNPGGIDECV